MCAVLNTARNGDVELPRQIGEFGIAFGTYNSSVERKDNRRRIQQLRRGQAGQSTAVNVADIVLARLKRVQVDAAQSLPNFRDAFYGVSTQLNLLTGSDIDRAISQAFRNVRNSGQLRAGGESVGHSNAHHELARRRLSKKDADPLQQFL